MARVALPARAGLGEGVVPTCIDAECDASLLVHDNTFYGDDEYDTGAAAAEWSDSDTEEDSSSTSVLRHGSDLTLAILRLRRVETKRSTTETQRWTLNSWTTRFFPYVIKTAIDLQAPPLLLRRMIGKILDVDARSRIASLTSTPISSSVMCLRQENSKKIT